MNGKGILSPLAKRSRETNANAIRGFAFDHESVHLNGEFRNPRKSFALSTPLMVFLRLTRRVKVSLFSGFCRAGSVVQFDV